MSLQLPPYMSFSHNEETKKAMIKVEDKTIRKQREMWGKFYRPSLTKTF